MNVAKITERLEKELIPNNISILPLGLDTQIKVDQGNLILACNQLYNLKSIMELASLNLIDSSEDNTREVCKKLYNKVNSDLQERLSSDFLLSSILYYNASFDYIRILLMYIYDSYEKLIHTYPKDKVADIMKKMALDTNWELALGFLMTMQRIEQYLNWLENSQASKRIKNLFRKLKEQNEHLRNKYQANQLKHGVVPCFKRTNPANAIGLRIHESIEQFYNKKNIKKFEYGAGFPENRLEIKDVQEFLISYHNLTTKLINLILTDISVKNRDVSKLKDSREKIFKK